MSPVKKPQTKVVDNLKTQLEELLAALNRLYDTIKSEMSHLGADFEEVNTVLVEGFRAVLDQQPPIEVVDSASSDSSGASSEDDSSESGDSVTDAEDSEARAKRAEAVARMVQSWSGMA